MVRSLTKTFSLALALLLAFIILPRYVRAQQTPPPTTLIPITEDMFDDEDDFEGVKGLDLRSNGRQIGQSIQKAAASGNLFILSQPLAPNGQISRGDTKHDSSGPNVQVNDPALDSIQSFPGFTRPFEESTQSETSIAVDGNNIVVGYNSSAFEPIFRIGNSLFATHLFFSAVSVSHDGGATWTSGHVPPPPGSIETLGDPSVGVDRAGNFYYASLAADAHFNLVIAVNKSTDHGVSAPPAVIAATDNRADKDWLAVGPDPTVPGQDNVYVTWTSFRSSGVQLWLARSTDGGATFTSKPIFAPVASGVLSNQLQFSNPVVDPSNGRLYIPFLRFSFIDADDIQVLASDDAGDTFHLLAFNAPGAPDAFTFPNVTPGELVDCGNGGLREVLHQGPNVGGGRFGLSRYVHSTRLITQPAAAANKGNLFLAFNTSTSPFFGDPAAGSSITLLFSSDGGNTWQPSFTVAGSTHADPQHVHPAITLTQDAEHVAVGYYVQQSDGKLRTDLSSVKFDNVRLRVEEVNHLSTVAFDITPSNIPFPLPGRPFNTTNYDRTLVPCYNIGEYMSVTASHADVLAAWGDDRQSWTSPASSPAAGVHSQADVVFSRGQN